MPAHREPDSLKKQCLLWYFNCVFHKRKPIDAKYVPVEIVDSIMQLSSEAQVNGAHISQVYRMIELHGHHCRHIHLEFKEWVNVYPMRIELLLNLISNNTNPFILKKFSIFGHSIPWNICDISKCLINLNGLTFLKLYVHNLNDQILETISKSCHNLEELYLQGMNFSNKSIVSLAGIGPNGEKELNKWSDRLGCPNLRILMMLKESRTPPKFSFNAIVCLLENLSKLESIRIPHYCLTSALIRLSSTGVKRLSNLSQYSANFSTISYSDWSHISNILNKIIRLSPHLTDLNITIDIKTSFQCLYPLSKLQHLHTFTITKALRNTSKDEESNTENIDKYSNSSELVSIIALFGHKLNHLELHNIYSIDLKQIIHFCPNLLELEVTNVKQITNNSNKLMSYRPNEELFKNLRHLKLFGHSENRITANNLIEILGFCQNLRFLKIGWCSSFDDYTIDRLLSMNHLRQLSHLEFHEMSEKLTIDSVMQIIITRVMALSLHLLYCDGISCEDIENLRQFVREFNIDLTLKYYYD